MFECDENVSVTRLMRFLVFMCVLFSSLTVSAEQNEESIRGLIKPQKKAVISSEIPAKIIEIPFKDGENFKQGDTLIRFDCSVYQAELASNQAEHNARRLRYENYKELLSFDATSNIEVELSKAEVAKAAAQVQVASIRVNRCRIRAPYDGRVIDVSANEHESVDTNTDLLSILNNKQLEIELIVPSSWLGWLKAGETFDFLVDETGQKYSAIVSRLGAAVDPVSQTIRVIGSFNETNDDILSGMSGSAYFKSSR